MDRDQLADFLRTRREALQPEDVGTVRGARRRTAGLRREEVAVLAGMSTDYYSRLEQRRGPQPSTQILAALARALRLDLPERDHLFRLAGHAAPDRLPTTDHVGPGIQRILDRLTDTPAQVVTPTGETLLEGERFDTRNTHGTGCTLASACAAGLAKGLSLEAAVAEAWAYVAEAIRRAPGLGGGHGPLDHGWPVRGRA